MLVNSIRQPGKKGRRFQFEACLAEDQQCKNIVKVNWRASSNAPALGAVLEGIASCADALNHWNASKKQGLKSIIVQIRRALYRVNSLILADSWSTTYGDSIGKIATGTALWCDWCDAKVRRYRGTARSGASMVFCEERCNLVSASLMLK
ncbi:hypothetical protein ACOSQ3_027224 [Xanthoceras sorbifolium]